MSDVRLSSVSGASSVRAMINDAVSKTVLELKKQNLLKSSQSPFQKTEQLLYNYNHFKSAITDKLAQIEELEIVGVPKQSKSITSYDGTGAIFDTDGAVGFHLDLVP